MTTQWPPRFYLPAKNFDKVRASEKSKNGDRASQSGAAEWREGRKIAHAGRPPNFAGRAPVERTEKQLCQWLRICMRAAPHHAACSRPRVIQRSTGGQL